MVASDGYLSFVKWCMTGISVNWCMTGITCLHVFVRNTSWTFLWCRESSYYIHNAIFSQGDGAVFGWRFDCGGNEDTLFDCSQYAGSFYHSDDVSVICSTGKSYLPWVLLVCSFDCPVVNTISLFSGSLPVITPKHLF